MLYGKFKALLRVLAKKFVTAIAVGLAIGWAKRTSEASSEASELQLYSRRHLVTDLWVEL